MRSTKEATARNESPVTDSSEAPDTKQGRANTLDGSGRTSTRPLTPKQAEKQAQREREQAAAEALLQAIDEDASTGGSSSQPVETTAEIATTAGDATTAKSETGPELSAALRCGATRAPTVAPLIIRGVPEKRSEYRPNVDAALAKMRTLRGDAGLFDVQSRRSVSAPSTERAPAAKVVPESALTLDAVHPEQEAGTTDSKSEPESASASTATAPSTVASRWAGVTEGDDPEVTWAKIKAFLQTQNSPLATWLGCADLKAIGGKRDPSARKQYVPKGAGEEDSNNATELLKMRTLFRAIRHDIGISPPTAYRNISNALKLVDRFGRPFVEQMLGRRIALDGHVLRDLVRLQDERQGRDVVHIYVEGAGETKAKRAIKAYLAAQAEKEREVAPMASQPAETGAPVAKAPSQQSPACAGLQGVTTRRLRLLRDGTVAEGVRVAEINDQEIVIEFVAGIHSATTAA